MQPIKQAQIKTPNFIQKVKTLSPAYFNFIGFNQYGDEYQQAVMRLVLNTLTVIFVLSIHNNVQLAASMLMTVYTTATIIFFIHTRAKPALNKNRIMITMATDVLVTTLATYLTNEVGSVFVGIFLWLVIGYGFRYGRKMLIATYVASLIGFVTASLLSPYWQTHMVAFYGLLFTLVTIPLYALSLLNKLKAAVDKAEAANKAKSEFLSHITHEIRTPLNGIVGACDLLGATNLNQDHRVLLNVMKSSSNMLLDLVNDVLDFSKIESGKVIQHAEEFYLPQLITNIVNVFESQATQKGLSLAFEINKETPLRVHGDLLHTKQVLINLVGNAVKFTEKGSIKIVVSAVDQGNSQANVKFEVIDTGTGIAPDSLTNIFDSFVQAEESKYKFGGTGLGTAISKNLVELMKGQIGVESTLGQGSTFWFVIPLEKLSSINTQENNISSEIIPFKQMDKSTRKKACHILVAEDNDTNILIISQMLTLQNHTFDIVKNGELALDKLRDNMYDLMILDYNMPVMGGLEALKVYQAINIGQPLIPAIILTADSTAETRALFDGLGVADFLTKPMLNEPLGVAIENAVNGGQPNTAEVIQYDNANRTKANDAETSQPKASIEEAVLLDVSRLDILASISKTPDFLQNLIQGFIEDTEQNFTLLATHIINQDYDNMNDVAHAIIGSAANIGANHLAKMSRAINLAKPSDSVRPEVLLSNALDSYEKTKLTLMHYLSQRTNNNVLKAL